MAFAGIGKVVLGSVAFGVFWVMAVFPAVPFFPIGLTAGSLLGALLMIIVGIAVNTVIILCMFWRSLSSPSKDVESLKPSPTPPMEAATEMSSHKFSPAKMSHMSTPEVVDDGEGSHRFSPAVMSHPAVELGPEGSMSGEVEKAGKMGAVPAVIHEVEEEKERKGRKRALFLKGSVYVVTVGMLAALLSGLDMSWTAITAAILLVVIDFRDAGACLEKVSYSLLIFFCGMFITMEGFNKTGIPSAFWDLMEPSTRVNRASGVAVLSIVILLLSNFASNVPTVLLLGAQVAKSATAVSASDVDKAWLILAWVSTVAGNFSLLGSAANLIICEQARRSEQYGYNLTFWKHLYFGLPSTLIITAIGLPLIRG